MSWAAVIVGGGALIGGALNSRSAGRAADAQVKGNDAAIAEQRRQFDLIMGMLQPQQQVGNAALGQLNRLYGLGAPVGAAAPQGSQGSQGSQIGSSGIGVAPNGGITHGAQVGAGDSFMDQMRGRIFGNGQQVPAQGGGTGAGTPNAFAGPAASTTPDMSGFFTSPGYQFRRDEGMRGIENSFAARGGAASGNALRALTEFNQNMATGEFGNYVNQLNNLAGFGQVATNQGVGAAQNAGNNIGNAFMNSGNARASGIIGRGNAMAGGINDLASIYAMWRGGAFGG